MQRCLLTTDLDEVGDRTHLTVFQMLGSSSLDDYGGPQSLRWGLEPLPSLWGTDELSLRILADHLRSAIVVIGDGVRPSATGRGYVLRRLLRRALATLWRGAGGSSLSLDDLPPDLVWHTAGRFGQVIEVSLVAGVLAAEERKFRELVSRGRALLRRLYPAGG